MSKPKRLFLLAAAAGVVACGLFLARPAQGEPEPENPRLAMQRAIERGKALWNQSWGPDGKRCAECHGPGANQMRSSRLKSYPKYDPGLLKVVTGQQKLNHMIATQAMGKALALGSDDLNALEAYIASLR